MIPNAQDETVINEDKESPRDISNLVALPITIQKVVISPIPQYMLFFKYRRYQPSHCAQLFFYGGQHQCQYVNSVRLMKL